MFRIFICFNADTNPDPACYLNADPDPDPGSQTNADPCGSGSWSYFDVTKSWILTWKNIATLCRRFICKFCRFPCSWIRILVPNTDPDLGEPKQCGSMQIRVGNTNIYKISWNSVCFKSFVPFTAYLLYFRLRLIVTLWKDCNGSFYQGRMWP